MEAPFEVKTPIDMDAPALLFLKDGKVWILHARRAIGGIEQVFYGMERKEPEPPERIPFMQETLRVHFRLEMLLPCAMTLLEDAELQRRLLAVVRPEPTKVKGKKRTTKKGRRQCQR